MEIKNTTSYTYDCIWEFNRSYHRRFRRTANILTIVVTGLFLFLFLMQGLLLLLGEELVLPVDSSVKLVVILGILIIFNFIVVPLLTKRTAHKQAANENVTDYIFTEDGFEQTTVSKVIKEYQQCRYDILVSVTESEHYFYLFITPRAAHIVAKNGFTEGAENDFRTLLRTVIDPKKLHIQ